MELDRCASVQDHKLLDKVDKGLKMTVRLQGHKACKAMNQALAGVATD